MKKAGLAGFLRHIGLKPYCAGAGWAGAGAAAGGVAGSVGAGAGSVGVVVVVEVSGTPWVVVLSVESLHAATLSRASAETEARTSFFITYLLMVRPHPSRRSVGKCSATP